MPPPKEAPVFFDQSGKRWGIAENIIVLLVALISVAAYWLVPQMLALRGPTLPLTLRGPELARVRPAYVQKAPSVSQLLAGLEAKNTAVIGTGPLVRLVHISQMPNGAYYALDPFSQTTLQKLTPLEISYLDGDTYALQRYGAVKEKRLALTFDDGPDEIYTPQLLDLLSRESAPSTFFVVGSNAARFPEIMKRVTSEGHMVGNHTFSHIDFDYVGRSRSEQEINQTQRLIVATTHHDTAFFRPPYEGNTDQSFRNNLKSILTAQEFGYTIASFDFDSDDWRFPSGHKPIYPSLKGNGMVVLLHDGGGDRSHTIAYVEELIHRAKSQGYSFTTLQGLYSSAAKSAPLTPTLADSATLLTSRAVLVWPREVIRWLFVFSLASLVAISLLNILLAAFHKIRVKYPTLTDSDLPDVTVIIPAYNEETVLEKSVASLLRSTHQRMKIIIVDDGSSDTTWQVASTLARRHESVTALHQINSGKAAALSNGIAHCESEIVICVDADTLFPPPTVMQLARHFKDPAVGAVAGVVKVGNPHSLLTKWQALEYVSGISIERNAQAHLGAITIVPGACGAWRRSAIVEAGGFSSSTLAEDCDLALKIQKTKHFLIIQDNEAISYTEAPQTFRTLIKQRFRWTFGNIQSLWKHRSMIFNEHYGWLGMYVMPNMLLSIIIPIIFWPVLMFVTIENILTGNYAVLLIFFVLAFAIQSSIALIGLSLAKERYSYIIVLPFAQLFYGPIRMYILYKAVLTVLHGVDVGWNKLARTGAVYGPFEANLELIHPQSKKA